MSSNPLKPVYDALYEHFGVPAVPAKPAQVGMSGRERDEFLQRAYDLLWNCLHGTGQLDEDEAAAWQVEYDHACGHISDAEYQDICEEMRASRGVA